MIADGNMMKEKELSFSANEHLPHIQKHSSKKRLQHDLHIWKQPECTKTE